MDKSATGYPLNPAKGASSAFAILFSISCILHIYQNVKYNSWRFFWVLPCVCIIAIAGFICLEFNAFHPTAYAPSQGLLYSAVIVLTAGIYVCLYQLMEIKPLLARWWHYLMYTVVMLLYTADIPLIAQGTSNFFNPDASPSLIQSDLAVLKGGVVLLLVFNLIFLDILIVFHLACSRESGSANSGNRNFNLFVFLLYTIGTLLLARNVFRTIQIFSHSNSPAWRVQTYFWVFDACPLLISTLLLNVLHPGKVAETTPRSQ